MTIYSEPGKGTTFRILLPCVTGKESNHPETAQRAAVTGRGELILVAEDSASVRTAISGSLTACSYHVVATENGQSLMNAYQRHRSKLRLLVVDIDLPGRSGMECIRDIRSRGDTTPVIVITGHIEQDPDEELGDDVTLLYKAPPL